MKTNIILLFLTLLCGVSYFQAHQLNGQCRQVVPLTKKLSLRYESSIAATGKTRKERSSDYWRGLDWKREIPFNKDIKGLTTIFSQATKR
jgi:hypothetical protein